MEIRFSVRFVLAMLFLSVLAGCETGISRHGTLVDDTDFQGIRVGIDRENDLEERLGHPLMKGLYDERIWIYMSERKRHSSIFKPRTIERQIAVVHFDEAGSVSGIEHRTLADGREFDFEMKTTPTQGRQQTLLEQIFGAIGLELNIDSGSPSY